jgi:GNAT superfamily N-acetyltransferase
MQAGKPKLSPTLIAELDVLDLEILYGSDTENFIDKADDVTMPSWPEFMLNDMVANEHWTTLNVKHPDFQFALYEKQTGLWIAVGNSIPVHWSDSLETLPDEGWDWALRSGVEDDTPANLLCALAIQVLPKYRGKGLSKLMVQIMKDIGQQFGYDKLIAPVRPNKKCDYPLLAMEEYLTWSRNGEHFDPWIRVHQRLGARILKVCPQAMHIRGTVKNWEDWTEMSFQSGGDYIISGALTSVQFDVENDWGDYVEPNVWMLHERQD